MYNEQNIYIIKKEKDKIYIYENEKNKEEEINKIKENCIQTFNLHKKIKTISNYKMDELTKHTNLIFYLIHTTLSFTAVLAINHY